MMSHLVKCDIIVRSPRGGARACVAPGVVPVGGGALQACARRVAAGREVAGGGGTGWGGRAGHGGEVRRLGVVGRPLGKRPLATLGFARTWLTYGGIRTPDGPAPTIERHSGERLRIPRSRRSCSLGVCAWVRAPGPFAARPGREGTGEEGKGQEPRAGRRAAGAATLGGQRQAVGRQVPRRRGQCSRIARAVPVARSRSFTAPFTVSIRRVSSWCHWRPASRRGALLPSIGMV